MSTPNGQNSSREYAAHATMSSIIPRCRMLAHSTIVTVQTLEWPNPKFAPPKKQRSQFRSDWLQLASIPTVPPIARAFVLSAITVKEWRVKARLWRPSASTKTALPIRKACASTAIVDNEENSNNDSIPSKSDKLLVTSTPPKACMKIAARIKRN